MSLHIAHDSGYILGASVVDVLSADYADYADLLSEQLAL